MKRNKTKAQHNLEKLATQSTQDEEKQNKTQHNLEKLVTQSTQDEEKQNKSTAQYVLDTTIRKETQIT